MANIVWKQVPLCDQIKSFQLIFLVHVNTKTEAHYGGIPLSHGKYDFTFQPLFPQNLHFERGTRTQFNFWSTCVTSVIFVPC